MFFFATRHDSEKMEKQVIFDQLLAIKDKLFRVAFTLLRSEEEAKDAVQDTYLKIWSGKSALEKVNSPEAFAMQSLKNLCIDILRKNKKRNMVDIESQYNLSDSITPFQKVSFENLKELMCRLFDTLPEQQRLVIHLRDIEHYSFEEIQQVTGMSVNNIRVILSRARKSVRSNYQKVKSHEGRRY